MDLGFGIETVRFFSLFTYFDRKNPFFTITCHFGMPKKSRTPNQTALLDVDWLSGKRADPRLRLPKAKRNASMLGTTLSVTALFVFVASAVGLWFPLSQRWLRERGAMLLNLGNSPADETLAMLVSLNALDQSNPVPQPVPDSQSQSATKPVSFDTTKTQPAAPINSVNSQSPAPIVTAYHTTSGLSDQTIPPPPPSHSGSSIVPAANRLSVARASLSDTADLNQTPATENPKLIAKSAEFTRSQAKQPIVVPVEQATTMLPNQAEPSANDDLRQLPIERLFPLLGSTQERRVRMVCDELSQRGIPNTLLDLAVQLARGDESTQLDLLNRLTQINEGSPAPVLCWMAQSSSKAVRKRAIGILGSLQDREVMNSLRFLASREPDSSLRQLIEQAVASNTGIIK